MCAFMAFFSVGIGPCCWIIGSEVFPTSIRAKALSIATAANRLMAGFVASTTLSYIHALGITGYFMLYSFLTFLSMLYIYVNVPETKGKTLEQVAELFEK